MHQVIQEAVNSLLDEGQGFNFVKHQIPKILSGKHDDYLQHNIHAQSTPLGKKAMNNFVKYGMTFDGNDIEPCSVHGAYDSHGQIRTYPQDAPNTDPIDGQKLTPISYNIPAKIGRYSAIKAMQAAQRLRHGYNKITGKYNHTFNSHTPYDDEISEIVRRKIMNVIKEDKENTPEQSILQYIKTFGEKGKLPNAEKSLKEYYKPYLQQAFEWASEKLSDVKRNGFAYFTHLFNTMVMGKIKTNKRGLIYVERTIELDPKALSNVDFNSVGECWSWKKNNGKAYCSNFGILDAKTTVTIAGYVHPDSVDWLETVYLNSYDMKNETEIRMNDNATVEVNAIYIHGIKYNLGGMYLINASSDKYKKKDW